MTTLHIAFIAPEKIHGGCPHCQCFSGEWVAYAFSTVPMSRKKWSALPACRPIDEWVRRTTDGAFMNGRGATKAQAVAALRARWRNRAVLDCASPPPQG